MRAVFKAGMIALMLLAAPAAVQAGTIEGVAIGAGGAPRSPDLPAVVGGVAGAITGGPNIVTRPAKRVCWRDRAGQRHCRWR